jgi:hypothetical protein
MSTSDAHAAPSRPGRRRRTLLVVVALVGALAVLGGCTPEQFQRWWVERGNAPLREPQLSEMARIATDYWNEVARRNRFWAGVFPIDADLAARMTPTSWRPGCPVPLRDLRYIRATFMGLDGREHMGEIVVHADAVPVTVGLLKGMWEHRFPIERMQLVDDFGGSDDASIAANNTSAFNCRAVTGGSGWSVHAYGRAIDINPVQNPYVTGSTVLPAAGRAYLDRRHVRPGMIVPGDPVWTMVKFVGWGWGGDWSSIKDYQHVSSNGR